MNQFKQVIILSAERINNTKEENNTRTNNLEQNLLDCSIKFNKAKGCYKGTTEKAFVCLPKNDIEIEVLKDFAFKSFNQESVMHQDSNGMCYLVTPKSETKIGKLREVNPKFIEKLDSYFILNKKLYSTEVL